MISDKDQAYLRHRTQLQRWWPWTGSVLLASVLGLWGYLFLSGSLLVNPWDREILQDGRFVIHPEYTAAIAAQSDHTAEE